MTRFIALGESPCQLFDLSSAVGDDSFYLAPLLSRPITVMRPDAGGLIHVTDSPSQRIHLSFHETGAVNLHIGSSSFRARSKSTGRAASGFVTRLAFGSLAIFRHVSFDKVISVPGKTTIIPVTGFWGGSPVCVDIYQVDPAIHWITPLLGDTIQIDACVKPNRKRSVYHFLIWQHTNARRQDAELAVYYSPL